jgi:hypothetical protein
LGLDQAKEILGRNGKSVCETVVETEVVGLASGEFPKAAFGGGLATSPLPQGDDFVVGDSQSVFQIVWLWV